MRPLTRSALHGLGLFAGSHHVGRSHLAAAGGQQDLAVAAEVVDLVDGQRLAELHAHAFVALQRIGAGQRQADAGRRRQRHAARQDADLQWPDQLGEAVELADLAGHPDAVAELDVAAVAAVVDEDAFGGRRVAVHRGIFLLHVEALQLAGVLEVADHHALDGDPLVHQRTFGAGALHLVDRSQAGLLAAAGLASAMLAEVGEGVARVAQPLRRRVEGVAGIAVAVADVGLAHQAPVKGLHIAAAPGRAVVEADLAEAVEDLAAAPAQQHRIVAIEPAAFHPLAGQRQQRRVGHAVGKDEGLARRQAAAQVDAAARRAGAVEIELDAVGGEVEDLAAAVVELQRLVVAAAFDILGDDQLGGVGHRQAQQGQAAQQGGVTQEVHRDTPLSEWGSRGSGAVGLQAQ